MRRRLKQATRCALMDKIFKGTVRRRLQQVCGIKTSKERIQQNTRCALLAKRIKGTVSLELARPDDHATGERSWLNS